MGRYSKPTRRTVMIGGVRFMKVPGGRSYVRMRSQPGMKRSANAFGKNLGRKRPRTPFAKAVVNVMNKYAEQKVVFKENTPSTGTQLYHNNIHNLDNNPFYTTVGTAGESGTSGGGNRVGKKIFVKGIKCAINLEAIQKHPLTHFWLYLIKNKSDPDEDITTQSEMYEGRSSTLPLDYIDTDKVDIMFCKKWTLRMPNMGTSKDLPAGDGYAQTWENGGVPEGKAVVTNPQKLEKFYVPVNRTFTYRDYDLGAAQYVLPVAPQRYQWVMVAYNNNAQGSDTANANSKIGKVWLTSKLLFTDV